MIIKFSTKPKTIATITLILLMATITLITDKPVAAQYVDTAGQYHSTMGGPIPTGVTPDYSIPTQAFLAATPNPIGVGQTILVNVWLTPATDVSRYHPGYKITITKPDGMTETRTKDSYYGDATAWFEYVPNQVGTYKFQFDFAGDYYAPGKYTENAGAVMLMGGASRNVTFTRSMYYQPSSTPVTTVTVQQEPVMSWPASPLPTYYWTRPISPENREWWVIAGNYPAAGQVGGGTDWPADTNPYGSSTYSFVPYVQAPNTAHVMWRMQTTDAGLLGGTHGTDSLVNQFGGTTPQVIYNGRAYLETTVGSENLLQCIDLRTGQVYWQIPNPIPSTSFFGMRFAGSMYISYYTGNVEVPGGTASSFGVTTSLIVIGSSLVKIDPFTGAVTLNVTGMSGTYYNDPYVLSVSRGRLINWTVAGSSTDFASRVVGNISWPLGSLPATTDFNAGVAVSVSSITPGGGSTEAIGLRLTAYSLKTGEKLWNTTDSDIPYVGGQASIADHGKIAVLMMGKGYWKAWDLQTGELAWTSQPMAYPWGLSSFGLYGEQSAYGLLYRESYDGVYAFNWTNGNIAWHFMAPSVPFETGYSGNYSFNGGAVIADGKLYTFNTEHTPSEPITRGWRLYCINATTGEGIWNITGEMSPGAVADGYLTAGNAYDGYMYVFGKGPSATTVEAPMAAITLGSSLVIRGTVTDISAGTKQKEQAARFPNGVPAVSDESQTAWMEYVYLQKPRPTDATGVEVTLSVLDSNNNYREIGRTTTDSDGFFKLTWKPDIEGEYTVYASFAGSESYYSSHAVSAFAVDPATEAAPPVELPPDQSGTYIAYATIAIIATIIICMAIAVLILRKR